MQAVILAGGESSRFWPLNKTIHKSQVKLLGKSLLYWTLKGLAENEVREAVIVHRPGSSIPDTAERENDLGIRLRFAVQESPLGTGDALAKAQEYITEPFFVFHPNKVNSGQLASLMLREQERGAQTVLAGAETEIPWEYGVLQFESGKPVGIVENPKRGEEPSSVRTLGTYLLPPDFFRFYEGLPKRHEADLVDALNLCLKEKKSAFVTVERDVPTLKYPWDLFGLLEILADEPYIHERVAQSARIGLNVSIRGLVYIGENAVIKDNTVIEGPCYIGDNCEIGYNNVIRGPVDFEQGVKTGAFFEVKRSILQEDTHFHSGYLGDSVVGSGCRVGAHFVSANRRLDRATVTSVVKGEKLDTGLEWFGTVVGTGTHIGIHAGTMPGVFVGAGCRIGPGTQVAEHVEDDTVLYAAPEKVLKKKPS